MESKEPVCGGCQSGCGNCQPSCGGPGDTLFLTEEELALLEQFAVCPFLPMARESVGTKAVCLDVPGQVGAIGKAILGLAQKGLIRVDDDVPLEGFDYAGYESYPFHGSMALTAWGLTALELLEIQGVAE